MENTYLLGAMALFVKESSGSDKIVVHDKYCTLQQLYRIRDEYQKYFQTRVVSITYGNLINSFDCVSHPELVRDFPEENKWDYITGLVDMASELFFDNNEIVLGIHMPNESFLKQLQDYISIPSHLANNTLTFTFTNVVDLFGNLKHCTKNNDFNMFLTGKHSIPKCIVYKRSDEAIVPSKSRFSDVGYDIHIIKVHKRINQTTVLYDTGIALNIPLKYYVEIVPRSSLSKTGYMLSNSVGIIDRSYRGNLYIALTKVSEDAIDIQFPFRCCQLIFRKQEFVDLLDEIEDYRFHQSTRDMGGFGSTG